MGVYIPNMEMPRNCTECLEFKDDCEHYWDYYCTHELRPNDCPLIEIVRCGECKYQYMCGHQINRHGLTLKLTCCEYGERRDE